jgi:hypothetical protein
MKLYQAVNSKKPLCMQPEEEKRVQSLETSAPASALFFLSLFFPPIAAEGRFKVTSSIHH